MQFPFAGTPSLPVAQSAFSEEASESSNLREIWAAAYRARFWIAGIFAVFILLAIAVALLSTKLYRATASVEVRQEAEKVLGTEQDRESGSSRSDIERFLQTQLDIIASRGMAEAVAEKEGLTRGDAFLSAMGYSLDDTTGRPGAFSRDARRDLVAAVLQKNLKAKYSGSTRIVLIAFTSPDPRLSNRIANAYAEAFIRGNLARKAGSSVYALDFLRNQLAEAQARLSRSEQAVVDYGRRTRIVDAADAAGSGGAGGDNARPQSLITAQLVQLNQAYSTAIADRIQAEQKWQQVERVPLTSIPEVLANPAIQSLLDRQAQTRAQYQQQLAQHREDFPSVIESAAQLREYGRQIATIGGNIKSTLRNQYDVARSREKDLAREIDTLKSSTLAEQTQGIQLSILRREADTNRQQYEALLRRYNSLNAESGIQTNNLSIVDHAILPTSPSWPKLPLNIALGIILALLTSAVFVFLREQLFHRIRVPDELSRLLGLPVLGVVPSSETAAEDLADPKSIQSDAYNSVRTSLSLLTPNGAPRIIMVTSTQQGEGKSTACHALALSFARLDKSVLIIDVDLRRPNIHRLFKVPNRNGLSNVLVGQIGLSEAIQKTDSSNLDIVVAGNIPPNPTELISSPQLTRLLREQAERYDMVLIDSAPVLGLADAVVLSHQADATVFVVESGRNSPRISQTALARLRLGGGKLAGAVLVKFDPGRQGYGYGTEYGYSYNYDLRDD